jgi:hypothetical protein
LSLRAPSLIPSVSRNQAYPRAEFSAKTVHSKAEIASVAEKLSGLLDIDYNDVSKVLQDHFRGEVYDYSTRLYSYNQTELLWTDISTGITGSFTLNRSVPFGCCWVQLPTSDLIFTGGSNHSNLNEAWAVRVRRELVVVHLSPMLTARRSHGACYFNGLVYVVGGNYTNTCERLCTTHLTWESLPDLPIAVGSPSVVELEFTECMYVLGGSITNEFIYELQLRSLQWRATPAKLPSADFNFCCFKVHTHPSSIFMVSRRQLLQFDTEHQEVRIIKTVRFFAQSNFGACCYCNGRLYCASQDGYPAVWTLGSLSGA